LRRYGQKHGQNSRNHWWLFFTLTGIHSGRARKSNEPTSPRSISSPRRSERAFASEPLRSANLRSSNRTIIESAIDESPMRESADGNLRDEVPWIKISAEGGIRYQGCCPVLLSPPSVELSSVFVRIALPRVVACCRVCYSHALSHVMCVRRVCLRVVTHCLHAIALPTRYRVHVRVPFTRCLRIIDVSFARSCHASGSCVARRLRVIIN